MTAHNCAAHATGRYETLDGERVVLDGYCAECGAPVRATFRVDRRGRPEVSPS